MADSIETGGDLVLGNGNLLAELADAEVSKLISQGKTLTEWASGEDDPQPEIIELKRELFETVAGRIEIHAQNPELQDQIAKIGEAALSGLASILRLETALPEADEIIPGRVSGLREHYYSRVAAVATFFERHGTNSPEAQSFIEKVAASGLAVVAASGNGFSGALAASENGRTGASIEVTLNGEEEDSDDDIGVSPFADDDSPNAGSPNEAAKEQSPRLILGTNGVYGEDGKKLIIPYYIRKHKPGGPNIGSIRKILLQATIDSGETGLLGSEMNTIIQDAGVEDIVEIESIRKGFIIWLKNTLIYNGVPFITTNGKLTSACRYLYNPSRLADLVIEGSDPRDADLEETDLGEVTTIHGTSSAPIPPKKPSAAREASLTQLSPDTPRRYRDQYPDRVTLGDLYRTANHLASMNPELVELGFPAIEQTIAEELEPWRPDLSHLRGNRDAITASRRLAYAKVKAMVQDKIELAAIIKDLQDPSDPALLLRRYIEQCLKTNEELFLQVLSAELEIAEDTSTGIKRRVLTDLDTNTVLSDIPLRRPS